MTQVADLLDQTAAATVLAPVFDPPVFEPTAADPARDAAAPDPAGDPAALLSVAELLELAQWLAAEPGLTDRLPAGATERSWLALPVGPGAVAWLIAWPPGTGTGWHDHGGSRGAMITVAGELTERSAEAPADHDYASGLPLPDENGRIRRFAAAQGRAFTGRHVHEVTNDGPVTAYSVHVYGPDLTLMRRFVPSAGMLQPIGAEIAGDW
jgi:Cysteine dioxygenase type I